MKSFQSAIRTGTTDGKTYPGIVSGPSKLYFYYSNIILKALDYIRIRWIVLNFKLMKSILLTSQVFIFFFY